MKENTYVDSIDLSELVKAINFSVAGVNYQIPPMNDIKMKKVMNLSKVITNLSSDERKDPLTDEEEDNLIKVQNEILQATVQKEDNKEFKFVELAVFEQWPMKLKNRVLELVFNQLGTGETTKVSAEQEKN